MNPVRVEFIRSQDAITRKTLTLPPIRQLAGLKVLDVGCGGGLLAESLARLGAKVTAIDPSEENIQIATAHSKIDSATESIRYIHGTVESMVESGEKFDIVCSLEVIEHVGEVKKFIAACSSCLESDSGSLFLSTINRTAKSFAIAVAGAEYISGVVPVGTHDWRKFITPSELEAHLRENGITVRSVRGMVLADVLHSVGCMTMGGKPDFRWKLSVDDVDVNYIVHGTKKR
jgi:ubiquinone biosynthesis O-methyltransferase